MFELIRANKRNSIILMLLMAAVLLSLGYLIGEVSFNKYTTQHNYRSIYEDRQAPSHYGGMWGIAVAAIIWMIMTLVSFMGGDRILFSASKAIPVSHNDNPQLYNVVEEMAISAGLPVPKVYIIPDPALNAFATGRNPKTASIAVTAGLLGKLNRDELQGVIAHEMSHVLHRDILFVTFAGIMLGSIVLISDIFLRSMYYGSFGRRHSSGSDKSSGQLAIIMFVIALIAAILAPLMAQLFYFALSRKREYMADAGSARLTRYPDGLADALEKIAGDSIQLETANKVTAPMYIANPFKGRSFASLTSTHPPIQERIRILRNMSAGVSLKDYSQAYTKTTNHRNIMPPSALTDKDIAPRQPAAADSRTATNAMHQTGDIIRKVNGFLFLSCTCGLKFKVPPNFKPKTIQCPRCGTVNRVPSAGG